MSCSCSYIFERHKWHNKPAVSSNDKNSNSNLFFLCNFSLIFMANIPTQTTKSHNSSNKCKKDMHAMATVHIFFTHFSSAYFILPWVYNSDTWIILVNPIIPLPCLDAVMSEVHYERLILAIKKWHSNVHPTPKYRVSPFVCILTCNYIGHRKMKFMWFMYILHTPKLLYLKWPLNYMLI